MPQDYYSDNPGDAEAQASAGPDTPKPAERKDADEGETFLVSKSALGGDDYKPGDRCEIEIVREYEDEYEAKHTRDNTKDSKTNPEMDQANSDMDEMANPGKGGY